MGGRRGGRAIPSLLLRLLLGMMLLLLIRLVLDLMLLIILLLLMLLVTMVLLLRLLLLILVLLLLLEMKRGRLAMPGLHRRRLCGRTHGEVERTMLRRHGASLRHIGLEKGVMQHECK